MIGISFVFVAVVLQQAAGGEAKSGDAAAVSTIASRGTPKTLIAVSGKIVHFAQDGDTVAWSTGCGILVRNLRTRATVRDETGPCDEGEAFGMTQSLALGGTRALWTTIGCGHGDCYTDVLTLAIGDRRRTGLVCCDSDGGFRRDGSGGLHVSAVAGDGQILAYSVLGHRDHPSGCADEGTRPCEIRLRGGYVQRVVGRKKGNQLQVPAGLLAASGSRLAMAPEPAKGCVCNGGPPWNGGLAWSPDGLSIAFSSVREGPDAELVNVPAHGGPPASVTKNFIDEAAPDWSPDGSRLVYTTSPRSFFDDDEIHVIGVDGKGDRTVLRGCDPGCRSPAWSPDGSTIAFERGGRIHVVRQDGSGERAVTQRGNTTSDSSPVWSPDGQKLAFTRTTYDAQSNPLRSEVWTVNIDGSDARRLLDGAFPSWSRGGEIAFVRTVGDDTEIFVLASDGTSVRQLTDNAADDSLPTWSPDGARLAFVRAVRLEEGELFVMNRDGSGQSQLTNTRPVLTRFPVEVRRASDASLISRFMPSGRPLAVALAPRFVGVLVRRGRSKGIELFSSGSGARLGFVPVPRATVPRLSIARRTLVVSARRKILLVDATRRRASVLAKTKVPPLGLSIEGRRVAWVERGRKRSRIRAVLLPRAG